MNKSERLNDMLRFLADKDRFNLSDLMNQFSISKSTALRDIQSLEKIGMPSIRNRAEMDTMEFFQTGCYPPSFLRLTRCSPFISRCLPYGIIKPHPFISVLIN